MNNMFLNLSNHPSASWEEAQLRAAAVYGKIVDLPFPAVNPTGDERYIEKLADEYFGKVWLLVEDENTTVHLMGEMTLTVAILKRLELMGIPCVASTSKRMVKEDCFGYKEVIFKFERFRKYNLE